MKIYDLVEKEPFSTLLGIEPEVLASIKIDMENNGYDYSYPIIIWGNIIIDGHTRVRAAKEVGLEEVPVSHKEFENENEAIAYAIHNQRDRRNLSKDKIVRLALVADELKERKFYGNQYTSGIASSDAIPQPTRKSAQETADLVGCSFSTVERIRSIKKYAPELLNEIGEGKNKLSISKAAGMAMEKKRQIENKPSIVKPKLHPSVNSLPSSIAKNIVETCKIQLARIPKDDPLRKVGLEDLIQYIKSIM